MEEQVSEGAQPPPKGYTFGWQRATLLGAFFNGVLLLALGTSILVQAIERFTHTIRKASSHSTHPPSTKMSP
jgi:Co/Zn/Cd efflux system component